MPKKPSQKAIPHTLTPACKRFFESQRRLTKFLEFLLGKIQQTEGDDEWNLESLINAVGKQSKSRSQSKELEEHLSLVCELIACRSVDNFLKYLSELLALVLKFYPGVMDLSKVQIDLSFVLAQSDIQSVRNLYMEKKIREMSFWSLRDLTNYLRDKFKFKLFENDGDRDMANNVIEERNLLVHNQGVVDRAFKEKAPKHPADMGDRIRYGPRKLLECIRLVERLAISIDSRASAQWALLPKVTHNFGDKI